MRVPVSWLTEFVDLPEGLRARELADALIRVGLEVETIVDVGADIDGPVVIGRVVDFVAEAQTNGKTIRWCQVDTGESVGPRGIVCGADNFGVDDMVVVALPGAQLPGGFAISARKTYGHVSDGMICSAYELRLGDERGGIMVLDPDDLHGRRPGDDARPVLGLPDSVLDIAVAPDRGYCLSIRGVGREAAVALDVDFHDNGVTESPQAGTEGWPVVIEDPSACDRFVTRTVRGFDPAARSPLWMRHRLAMAGMRPISLAVDVTNYVMLALGQPVHGYDAARLSGPLVVRRGRPGERIETLDGVVREVHVADVVIADGSGPIGLAGLMGGATTELGDATSDIVIEAAHFDPVAISRSSRRHRLGSEASRRFERGVDHELPPSAAQLVADLLVRFGGGSIEPLGTDLDLRTPRPAITLDPAYPGKLAGVAFDGSEVVDRLESVGCTVTTEVASESRSMLKVMAPSWRPDLTDPADLTEEVIRLHGYESIPSVLPDVVAGASHAYTRPQRHRVQVSRALAGAGFIEVRSYPFIGHSAFDALGFAADDDRRRALRLANPLSDEEPLLRTTMLPGLLATARRNLGRGFADLAIYEVGRVFMPRPGQDPAAALPRLPIDRRPRDADLALLDAALPDQPDHLAVVLVGDADRRGWWGPGRRSGWDDAVEAAKLAAHAVDAPVRVRPAQVAPWHPGRCAELVVGPPSDEAVVGWAGELHPKVCESFGLPPRSGAAELSLEVLAKHAEPADRAPVLSMFPIATQDVALVVAGDVRAADVQEALRRGAGNLLESVRLFDVYTGDQIGPDHKSLAFSLRFRALDRTLTTEEATAARDAAVAEAGRAVGATLRG